MKYGKGTNKGTLKVCRKCGTATVKVRLHSTELVRSCKTFFNRTYNVPSNVRKPFFGAYCILYFLVKCLPLELAPGESSTYSHRTGVVREPNSTETMRRCLQNITRWVGQLVWMQSFFFSKTKPKKEKVVFISP